MSSTQQVLAAGPRAIGQRAAAVARTPPPARLGFDLGDRLCRSLCGGVLRIRRIPDRLRAVDGQQAIALRRADRRSALPADGGQYPALCRPRREREDVPGLAAVRLLHAPALVDQSLAGSLYFALGAGGDPGLHLVPLDADRRAGLGRRPLVGAVRDRRSDLVQSPLARTRIEHRRLYLEMDAVLDPDLPRRPDDDPAGHL